MIVRLSFKHDVLEKKEELRKIIPAPRKGQKMRALRVVLKGQRASLPEQQMLLPEVVVAQQIYSCLFL